MTRTLFALLLAIAWSDGHAQSALPPCSAQTGVFGKAVNTPYKSTCFGRWEYIGGNIYVGEWLNNKRHGRGTMTQPDGYQYVGQWKDDKPHGQGRLTLGNGVKYEGEFSNAAYNGKGTLILPDGSRYVGEWQQWEKNGRGIMYKPDGTIEASGLWVNGRVVQPFVINTADFPFEEQQEAIASANGQGDGKEADALVSNALERIPDAHVVLQPVMKPASSTKLRRVALVIGNAKYTNAPALINPPADAASIATALREAEFQTVIVKNDLSQQATLAALRDFANLADTSDWAVVYYAGHGIEFGGVNYLIPTDALLKSDRDVDLEGVDLSKVVAAVEGAKRLRLIILDACRDNPFASQMRRTMASRSIGRGLARVEPEPGTLIAYAAKHGETAIDGMEKRNSPFAEALVKRIRQTPPIEVRRLFDYVRDDVLEATNKKQQPFSYGSVSANEDFYFVLPK